jgi:hypothetical protein
MPLQDLHDCPGLTRVYFFRAFPGDDPDLEPDLNAARPVPFRYIIADHTDILTYSTLITSAIPCLSFTAPAAHFFSFPERIPGGLSLSLGGALAGGAACLSVPSPAAASARGMPHGAR